MARAERLTGPARVLANIARVLTVLTWPFVRFDVREGCARKVDVAIAVANHRSMFDVVAGLICLHKLGHYPRLLMERHYVEEGWTGPLARAIGTIPVDRAGAKGTALDHAFTELRRGVPVLVMPEGRLYWNPDAPFETGPAKTGVSRLALGGGVPVVPVGLSGTERVMPPKAKLPRLNPFKRKVVVCQVADDPIWLTGEDHQANTAEIMAAVEDLLRRAAQT
jgi:1-acyl-sn-glycerol-3-phosphate acyltransferase